MRKLAINIVVFLIIYCVLHVLVVCIIGENLTYYKIGSYGHMYTRIKEIPLHNNPDILFLGSSHSYRGFDSRIFSERGITTFNLGSSSQTPKQTEVLLKKYLSKIKPKMIVFEVYPGVFQGDGIESTTDLISNDHIDYEICKLALLSENVKVINTLIYGLYQEYICNIRESFVEDRCKDGDVYVFGGYVEKTEFSPFVRDSISPCNTPIIIRQDQLKAFERCINLINDNDIPCLLVEASVPNSTYKSMINHAEFSKSISSYGKYVDFNTILQLDDTCFFDSDHLAQPGVCLFNDCLIRVLDTIDLH